MADVRIYMDKLFAPVFPFFSVDKVADGTSKDIATLASSKSLIGMELPSNVQLLSLERVGLTTLLVRLAHQFDIDEDIHLSQSVEIDLFALLQPYAPVTAVELTLSASQDKALREAEKIMWKSESSDSAMSTPYPKSAASRQLSTDSSIVVMHPLQIRTFSVEITN